MVFQEALDGLPPLPLGRQVEWWLWKAGRTIAASKVARVSKRLARSLARRLRRS